MLPVALAACATRPRNYIDPASAGRQISTQLAQRYPRIPASVDCPSGVEDRVGNRFTCRAEVDGQPVRFDVVVAGGSGQLTVSPAEAILAPSTVAAQLESEISSQTGRRPAVSCPSRPVLVVATGGTFSCAAVFDSQAPRNVIVTVHDVAGDFGFVLAPAGA